MVQLTIFRNANLLTLALAIIPSSSQANWGQISLDYDACMQVNAWSTEALSMYSHEASANQMMLVPVQSGHLRQHHVSIPQVNYLFIGTIFMIYMIIMATSIKSIEKKKRW